MADRAHTYPPVIEPALMRTAKGRATKPLNAKKTKAVTLMIAGRGVFVAFILCMSRIPMELTAPATMPAKKRPTNLLNHLSQPRD